MPFTTAMADIQPRSASLNYSQKSLSNVGNPAAAALIFKRKDPHVITGGLIEFGVGIEYGDLNELFAKFDELSNDFKPPNEPVDPTLPPTPENPIRDSTWDDLFNEYPELEDRLDAVKDKVSVTAGLLALIAAEGYAKAEATGEMTFVLNDTLYGGTLMIGASYKGNAKAIGILEPITFDSEFAKTQLSTIPNFEETDPIQDIDLSGGITLFYNPANNKVKLTVDNDSLLLVKATKISQFSLSYSRQMQSFDSGDLYWGIKPTFYRVGLTNVSSRIGDITDSEALFDDIKDANYVYENGFDLDLGLVWAAPHYQLGASITSLFEHTYEFPEIDRRRFSSKNILTKLDYHEEFTMQRQVKLEAGIYTEQRHWSLNAELDANSVEDPMRDQYQWLTVTAGYAADNWWLPSARVGFSRNLAGTKLAYLNAGVTVMKFINIDLATTLDTVTLDGDEIRRGVNIRVGVQFDY
ncbi:conjugal transfer protein TraF [Candidatus Colwellia aromaticivorans]|uniref:conjugal transfer protein TraF n=1 Tax=Candidatus Colwellia aromaticivorans TaxID=2267621 RepID=UPI000DF31A15|nr:conjugal transfer protein TraF [Candidatus Colwellia aromaticivorans]